MSAEIRELRSHKWMVLSNTTLGMLAAAINSSILLISLPAVFRGIGLKALDPGNINYLLWAIIGYMALIAGALAMLLQTWAQARVEASRAAVIMAMEPVWAATFAVAFGGEAVSWRMVLGGGAILAAMYLVELAPRRRPPANAP